MSCVRDCGLGHLRALVYATAQRSLTQKLKMRE